MPTDVPIQRACYRALARLLPREFRTAAGDELESAALACIARERARLGPFGAAFAWTRLVVDTIMSAGALRRRSSAFPHDPHHPRRGVTEAFMDNLLNDIRYALRGLARQPGFTALTVLTLALGIGANTAIFSVVNGVLLRPLPYPHPEQLEYITTKFPAIGFDQFWMSPPEVLELEAHNTSFSSVGGFSAGGVTVGTAQPSRPVSAVVTPGLMPTLGVLPLTGRWFSVADAQPGAEDVAILSFEYWRRSFGGDSAVIGRKIQVDTVPFTIVGIMPRGFDVHDQKVEVWLPLTINPERLAQQRGSHFLYVVARRKDGVTAEQARADLAAMQGRWKEFVTPGPQAGHLFRPDLPNGHVLRIDPLKADVVGNAGTALLLLQAAVGLVLFIACANLANLLLARAESRQREFAVRAALGAGRGRMFGQFVTEGLVLALMAATAGVGLAWLALRALLSISPDAIPRSTEVGLDGRVLLFTLLITVATGVIFGLAPLSNISRRLLTTLRDGTRATGGRVQRTVRNTLVIAEVTLAVVLVVGAGLLVRSLTNLLNVDAGFDRSRLITFSVVLPEAAYGAQRRVDFFTRLEAALGALPGVESVASMTGLPPNRSVNANDTDFEHIPNNQPVGSPLPIENVDYWQGVTQRYTGTMGIPIVSGRGFEAADVTGPPVVLVNETLAKRFFTSQKRDPIGGRIKPGFDDSTPFFTVVGVVKDVKQAGVDAPVGAELYLLSEQGPRLQTGSPSEMNVVLRTGEPLFVLAQSIERTVKEIDAGLPIVKLRTMDAVFGDSVARPRFITLLLGIFAALALLLAAIGTYGVLSYLVTQQAQEIGIRMALGADRRNVLGLVLGRGLRLAGIGLVLGTAGALAAGRLMANLLFNVSPTDPFTIGAVVVTMAVVATGACLIPAFRATRVDPIKTLRT